MWLVALCWLSDDVRFWFSYASYTIGTVNATFSTLNVFDPLFVRDLESSKISS